MKLKKVLLLVVGCIPLLLFSQNNDEKLLKKKQSFSEGYIITQDSDTTLVKIVMKLGNKEATYCHLVSFVKEGELINYRPEALKGYGFIDTTDEGRLHSYRTFHGVFMRRGGLHSYSKELFPKEREDVYDVFILVKTRSSPEVGMYYQEEEFLYIRESNLLLSANVKSKKGFYALLNKYFSDCPSINKKIVAKEFKKAYGGFVEFDGLVREYNNWRRKTDRNK